MKVLITGGNGFIGSHLATELSSREDTVTLYDIKPNTCTDTIYEDIYGDVRDYTSLKKAIEGKDFVFHFAAISRVVLGQQNPLNCFDINFRGTINVLEACRKTQSNPILFFASSREVYGRPRYLPIDEKHPKHPISVYGVSKLCAEKACFSYKKAFSSKIVILRFSNVYGSEKDQMDRVIPKFILNAIRGKELELYGGNQIIDFVFIKDVIDGICKAYNKGLNADGGVLGEAFHFVTGKGTSILDLAKMITKICNSNSKIIQKESRDYDTDLFVGDPTKSDRILGFKANIHLKEGLEILREKLALKY